MADTAHRRARLLDRLVARSDLSGYGLPTWPMMACLPASVLTPLLVAATDNDAVAFAAGFLTLACAVWLGLALGRLVQERRRPYASARWLHAVRGVVGDDAMAEILAGLARTHAREPDHVLYRREVIDAVLTRRRLAREEAERTRGVRLHGAG